MGFSCDMASGIEGSVVQLVRMLPCHGRGRGFESRPLRNQQKKRLVNQKFARRFCLLRYTLWYTFLDLFHFSLLFHCPGVELFGYNFLIPG